MVINMTTQNYSDLKTICKEKIEYAAILTHIDTIRQFNIAEYVKTEFPQKYKNRLPSSFRAFILAVTRIKPSEVTSFLESWKEKLKDPMVGLSEDNVDYFYIFMYALLFIRLYAYSEHKELFDRLYSDIISLCNPF